MKPLNQFELMSLVEAYQSLKGSCVQEIVTNDQGIALRLFQNEVIFMVFDLKRSAPGLFCLKEIPFWKKSGKAKPMGLFLSSHLRQLFLQDIELMEGFGRVLKLRFVRGGEEEHRRVEMMFNLIPKQGNLSVRVHYLSKARVVEKEMHWYKPQDLKKQEEVASNADGWTERSIEEIHEEWILDFGRGSGKTTVDPKAKFEKWKADEIKKKQRAFGEIEKLLVKNESESWRELGESLKYLDLESLPEALRELVDRKLGRSENRERAFHKAKQIEEKKSGHENRQRTLLEEIGKLERLTFEEKSESFKEQVDLLKKGGALGRKKRLSSGVEAFLGKSAQDNLKLLRAARAWDVWVHLRDYPSAHAIIRREKNQELSPKDLNEVGHWVAQESLSKKTLALGQKIEIISVECRFIRPIKGDKAGRVNYNNEKVYTITYSRGA